MRHGESQFGMLAKGYYEAYFNTQLSLLVESSHENVKSDVKKFSIF